MRRLLPILIIVVGFAAVAIDFAPITRAVLEAGYTGDTEVEIFNADVWAADPDEVLATMKARYAEVVLPA